MKTKWSCRLAFAACLLCIAPSLLRSQSATGKIPRRIHFSVSTEGKTAFLNTIDELLYVSIAARQRIVLSDFRVVPHNICYVTIQREDSDIWHIRLSLEEIDSAENAVSGDAASTGTRYRAVAEYSFTYLDDLESFRSHIEAARDIFTPHLGLVEPKLVISTRYEEELSQTIADEIAIERELNRPVEVGLFSGGLTRDFSDVETTITSVRAFPPQFDLAIYRRANRGIKFSFHYDVSSDDGGAETFGLVGIGPTYRSNTRLSAGFSTSAYFGRYSGPLETGGHMLIGVVPTLRFNVGLRGPQKQLLPFRFSRGVDLPPEKLAFYTTHIA